MSVEIRPATLSDATAACHVLRRSIAECCLADHHNDPQVLAAWLGNKTPEMVQGWFASPTNHALVACEGEAVLGVALLTRAGKLALCYLLPEACRQGTGKLLLAAMEAQAREWGVKALQLHSTATAEKFFAREGYHHGGIVRSPYGVDTVFFWKPLDESAVPVADAKRKRFCNCDPGS